MILPEDFATNLAANLVSALFEAGISRLGSLVRDSPEEQALRRCYEAAFKATLREVASDLNEAQRGQLADVLHRFVKDPDVAQTLLDLALAGDKRPDLSALREKFDALGFDRETLPVDFDQAMVVFLRNLGDALIVEAERANSPLFQRVNLEWMQRITRLMQSQEFTLVEMNERLMRLEKLIENVTLHDDVLIVKENVIKSALSSLGIPPAQDITEYIQVTVRSNRFGRKLQLQVPHDITTAAFINLVIEVLGLPRKARIPRLMISFKFAYSVIFKEQTIPLNQTFRDAGVSNGDTLLLFIRAIWTDEIEKESREIAGVIYLLTAKEIEELDRVRKAREALNESKIRSLANSCFSFIDEI